MKKLVSHDEMVRFAEGLAGIFGQGMKEVFDQLSQIKASLRGLEDKVEILMNTPEVEPPAMNDVGLDKNYPGHGWYKATDTGIVYNKGVPEGETHVFSDGDPTEYLSVYTKEDAVDNVYIAATSNVTDLSSAFFNEEEYRSTYIGQNLSHWDVSNVTSFEKTFFYAQTQDIVGIENWKTSSAINMDSMFAIANTFNTDISGWDVSNVTNMKSMFTQASSFNQDISGWDVSNVENMNNTFNFAGEFNQDLSEWCVAKIPTRPEGWEGYENIVPPVWGTCPRGEDGSNPKTEPADQGLAKDYPGAGWYKATDTGVVYNVGVPEGETHIFEGDPIEYISVWRNGWIDPETGRPGDGLKLLEWHKNLHRYATSNVTDMTYWMYGYGNDGVYNQVGVTPDFDTGPIDISHYDTSNVINMMGMFSESTFNQPLDNFDTSNV